MNQILSENEIWSRFFDHISSKYGVTSALYGISASPYSESRVGLTNSLIIRHNHPEEYVKSIGGEKFLNDDICTLALVGSSEPFLWHLHEEYLNPTPDQRARLAADIRFNMMVGVSLSLPFAGGRGLCGVGLCMGNSSVAEFTTMWNKHSNDIIECVRQFDISIRPIMIENRLKLTKREKDVLICLAGGMGAKEIAHHLNLQPKTIYNTVERARIALKSSSTIEAVYKAKLHNLI